jgi:hypothetical protein
LVVGFAAFGVVGAFDFDVADGQPDEFDDRVVDRELPRFLMVLRA